MQPARTADLVLMINHNPVPMRNPADEAVKHGNETGKRQLDKMQVEVIQALFIHH